MMIIRRKMPRRLSRRPLGIIGLRTLQRSSDHVRRMVVSQLPTSFSNVSTAVSQSEQPSGFADFDAPLTPPNAGSESRMPKDLQALFDMHKALGHVQTSKKSFAERVAEQRASEPQLSPPSTRIQKRPENVRYEPDSRIQRTPSATFAESDIEPLPEMPPPKSNRVRSFVEYVNISSGVPERQSSEGGDGEVNTESEPDSDWMPDDDMPDAMSGSYAWDTVDTSGSDSIQSNNSIQRYTDDTHPTQADIPYETLQSSHEASAEFVQRQFDPVETSDEELYPPSSRYSTTASDRGQDDYLDDDDAYTATVIDTDVDSPPVQRSFAPIESSDEELPPPARYEAPRADSNYEEFANDFENINAVNDTPPVQRSFAPIESSDEELLPPVRYDVPRTDESYEEFDSGYKGTTTVDKPVSVQRSFAPIESSDEELLPPARYDLPQSDESHEEFSDDNDNEYGETSVDNPSIQRSFASLETSTEELLPPIHEENYRNVADSDDFTIDRVDRERIKGEMAKKSPPLQRQFEAMEVDAEDLLPPVSYSSDTTDKASTSSIQRSTDDDWQEVSSTIDLDEPSFEQPSSGQRQFNHLEASQEDLLPPSYQQYDRPSPEKSTRIEQSQPRRMAVSRSDSPTVQRFPQSADEPDLQSDYDESPSSELPYQALDLGQALLDAGFAKSRQDLDTQPSKFPVLMPPIGRAHHSTKSSTMQHGPVGQSIQRTEAPVPSQLSPQSVESSLLDALGMSPDTVVQRSGPQMPAVAESPSDDLSVAVQRVEEGGEGGSTEAPKGEDDSSSNVEEMAKQVYRLLQRRFRIERERSQGR